MQQIKAGRHRILSSTFVLGEILVLPVRKNDAFTVGAYRRALLSSDAVEIVQYTADAAMRFAALRATERTHPADSIHLALAAAAGADMFITADQRLRNLQVPGIGRIADLDVQLS